MASVAETRKLGMAFLAKIEQGWHSGTNSLVITEQASMTNKEQARDSGTTSLVVKEQAGTSGIKNPSGCSREEFSSYFASSSWQGSMWCSDWRICGILVWTLGKAPGVKVSSGAYSGADSRLCSWAGADNGLCSRARSDSEAGLNTEADSGEDSWDGAGSWARAD